MKKNPPSANSGVNTNTSTPTIEPEAPRSNQKRKTPISLTNISYDKQMNSDGKKKVQSPKSDGKKKKQQSP
jgi:hypothetical protein